MPGTLVLMADGTTKPIEDIENGDRVLATDPETGETAVETVTAEILGKGVKHLVKVEITTADGTTAEVTATDVHPFWVPELGEWIDATDLKPGQWLRTSAGTYVQIKALERWTAQRATVHNLTVSDLHTYYVLAGSTPVLVHNSTCTSLPSTSTDGLAVIGRQRDVEIAKDWPDHEVLDLPAAEWTSVEDNDRWIQGIIEARKPVYVASPTEGNLTVGGRPTVFARELRQFNEAGYTRSGDYLLPPRRSDSGE